VIKMIATDMDGTFLKDNRMFNQPRFQKLLTQMNQAEIHFVAASGNQLIHLKETFADIKGEVTYVAENGAVIAVNDQIIQSEVIPSELWKKAINWVMSEPAFAEVHVILSGKNGAYTELKSDSTRFGESSYFYSKFNSVTDLMTVSDDIYKVDLTWEDEDVRAKEKLFNETFSGKLRATSSGLGGLDVILPHVHKAYALKQLQKEWQVSPAETLTFGDSGNDIEMLRMAKYGYAMKNAAPEVLTIAPFVTKWDNNDEGVLNTIAEYIDDKG